MKTGKLISRLFASVLITGCADGDLLRSQAPAETPPSSTKPGGTSPGSTIPITPNPGRPAPGTIPPALGAPGDIVPVAPSGVITEVRLRGADAADFQSLVIRAQRIEVRADEHPIALDETGLLAELTDDAQAWLLGTFVLPVGTRDVHVLLDLDDVAAFDTASASGELEVRDTRIEFTVPAQYVGRNTKAVVVIDAARSVVVLANGQRAFVPQYRVMY